MGGLLAARVLSNHFDRVTLVERDELPVEPVNRKGVPQGRHTHALLAKGGEVLEAYFPGLTNALIADGVPSCDPGLRTRFIAGGQRLAAFETGWTSLMASRPLLEWHVRRRLLAMPGVELLDQHDVRGLALDGERVTGARIAARDGASEERVLAADLVVDAMGRGSKTPEWLSALGFPAPEQETVRVDVGYVTRWFKRRPTDLGGDLAVISSATSPNKRACAILAQENDRWTATLVGYLGERPPLDLEGYIEYARGLPTRDAYELLKQAEPIGEPMTAAYPASVRRRYDRLTRFPDGYVVFADSICGFNPIFGQGMTVASVEATLLDEVLAAGHHQVGKRFFARTSTPLDAPWNVTVGNDLSFPEVEGRRTFGSRLINAYMGRYIRAAAGDAELSRAFAQVGNLCAPPSQLMHPRFLRKVLLNRGAAPKSVAVADVV
jgi:2-polyprenyl-6-methoxyphenol hydroxylase-like FAD-dependent oxidoreductase